MKRLKLFEEYSNDPLQEAQDFLEDNFYHYWKIGDSKKHHKKQCQ